MSDRECLSSAPPADEGRNFAGHSLRATPQPLRPPERQMIRPGPPPPDLRPRPPTLPDYRFPPLTTQPQSSAVVSSQLLEWRWACPTSARPPPTASLA